LKHKKNENTEAEKRQQHATEYSLRLSISASEMTYIVSGGALNSTHPPTRLSNNCALTSTRANKSRRFHFQPESCHVAMSYLKIFQHVWVWFRWTVYG